MRNFKIETISHLWRIITIAVTIPSCAGSMMFVKNQDLKLLILIIGVLMFVALNRLSRSYVHLVLDEKRLFITEKIIPFLPYTRNYQINLNEIIGYRDADSKLYSLYSVSSKNDPKLIISRYIFWKDERDDFGSFKDSLQKAIKGENFIREKLNNQVIVDEQKEFLSSKDATFLFYFAIAIILAFAWFLIRNWNLEWTINAVGISSICGAFFYIGKYLNHRKKDN